MTEGETQLRVTKLKALIARNGWAISDDDAQEYVLLEAKTDRTEAESVRKKEIIQHTTGRTECTCPHCQIHAGEGE